MYSSFDVYLRVHVGSNLEIRHHVRMICPSDLCFAVKVL